MRSAAIVSLAFFACSSDPAPAPAPAPATATATDTATATATDTATATATATAAATAPAMPDAAVLVPATWDDDPAKLDRRIRAAVKAKGRHAMVLDSTTDYGCMCPPFVFAPFWNGENPTGYPYLTFLDGVPDVAPYDSTVGLIRIVGRFTGKLTDGKAWLQARGEKLEQGMDEYRRKGPEVVVEAWCVEIPADREVPEHDAATIRKVVAEGRLCPGGKPPRFAPPE